jgi:hypothetical protein
MKYMCIYQRGKQYIETACPKDIQPYRSQYGGELFDDLIKELNSKLKDGDYPYEIMPLDDACLIIEEINVSTHCKPWREITKEDWWDKLEILPPEKWETVSGVEIFRMMEYYTGNITSHYARIGDRYFTAMRPTSTKYIDIAKEVASL